MLSERTEPKDKKDRLVQRNNRECYKCYKQGHIAWNVDQNI